jgi:hypothetical protein
MARPKKDPSVVRGEIVRIPVSADEKTRMYEAAVALDGEFARWARPILLKAADEYRAGKIAGGRKPLARKNDAQPKKKAVASALE